MHSRMIMRLPFTTNINTGICHACFPVACIIASRIVKSRRPAVRGIESEWKSLQECSELGSFFLCPAVFPSFIFEPQVVVDKTTMVDRHPWMSVDLVMGSCMTCTRSTFIQRWSRRMKKAMSRLSC